ncbi:hypothetical protein ABTY61_36820 [Kitasatospora sp. NPDC096128]|uniref:hypothetical protein n=1 Tax=Kitasatospora sp. NPDC096128 TaxID=3155547 RepID=UPI003328CD45
MAALPGVDPGKNITIGVDDGVPTVQAERGEEKKDKQRSEFRYPDTLRARPTRGDPT